MSDPTPPGSSTVLAAGGAAFLALAGFFLWRDLALPRELAALAVTLLAGTLAAIGQPRRWPAAGPAALLASTALSGSWFVATKNPGLLPALAVAPVAALVAVARSERAAVAAEPLADQLRWYALGSALLAGTAAFYFHVFTIGLASDSVARRLVLTIAWLAPGLALFIAGAGRRQPAAHVGLALIAVALGKALFYDTTHLAGPLRVLALGCVGGLLLAAAAVVRRRPTAGSAGVPGANGGS